MMTEMIFVGYSVGVLATYAFLWATRMSTMNPIEATGYSVGWPVTVGVYLMRGGWWK